MSEFKIIETQEELDAIINQVVAKEREKFSDYDQLKIRVKELEEQNIGLESTLQGREEMEGKYTKQITELEQKISGYETTALKQRIALQQGLPFELAERLNGADEQALKEDAERLSVFIRAGEPTPPLKDVEPQITSGENAGYKQLLNTLKFEGE